MKQLSLLFFLLTAATMVICQNTRAVQFSWGAESLPDNFETIKVAFKADEAEIANGKLLRYVQFYQTLNTQQRKEMLAMGVDVLGYVYPSTYLLLLPVQLDVKRLEPLSPRSIVPLKPEWKMARSLHEPPYGDWAVHGEWIDINLQACPHFSIPAAANLCREQGMVVLKEGNQNGIIQARVLQDQLLQIATLPFIQYLELIPPPGEKEDTRGRSLHRSNIIDNDHAMGRKYNGAGVRTLVRDDGQLGPHIDFHGRLFNRSNTPQDLGTHGDGVGGIIGGAGNLNPNIKGMAAGAEVYVVDYVNDFLDETLPLHLNEGVTLTNSSYSDNCNAGYTLATQTVDSQLYSYPTLMHVFSAGNSNGQDCDYGAGNQWGNITGGHKMAKNAIATANLTPDASLDASSSRGPAYDGRLKPDISANGTNQFSTDPNNDYQEFGGTSAASPGVVGCLAQLTQAYKAINGSQAPTALLKAAILNTANDLGNVGPDFKFGWGHINAWRALQLLEQHQHLQGQVEQGAEITHTINIPDGVKQARLMLVWPEPQANPGASKALVNDLDLTVLTPNNTVKLPWKLDPTPNPTILNLPAGNGRDSLNNVEQVAILDPAAGAYTVVIKGFDVPLGPQGYHLVWDFTTGDVKMTYPAGGEGFEPGTVQRIHWDAFGNTDDFSLGYSTDGGASFSPIVALSNEKRMYDWTVPNTLNGQIKLLLTRGSNSDTTDFPFSIAPVPQNLAIAQVCPDSMTITWNEIHDTLSYDVYVLGAKYMEIKGRFDMPMATVPVSNAGQPQWVSVRVAHADGTTGQRAIAVNSPGGLKNCPQEKDLALKALVSPKDNILHTCSSTPPTISIQLANEGQTEISGAQLHYQVDNQASVVEAAPSLMPGTTQEFTFQTPFNAPVNGTVSLKIWSASPGDVAYFNDTLFAQIKVIDAVAADVFLEDFESSTNLPDTWAIGNPDDWFTWSPTNIYINMIGINGERTRAFFVNHYDYEDDQFQEDYLYMIPVDLSALSQPSLTFDLAHRNYSSGFLEGFRVELFPDCNLGAAPLVLLDLPDPALSTTTSGSAFFVPTASNQWRRHTIDLADYVGQTAVIRFVSVNAFGNNTFIDNIGISEFQAPIAEIINDIDTICRLDTIYFAANDLVPNTIYSWSFGSTSFPSTETGTGPFAVVYPVAGIKNIQLIATNPFGADTAKQVLVVKPFPTPNFTQSANNLTVSFNNTSTNADSYLWDFGDGMSSTEINPVHTYAASGAFAVKLSATNDCRTNMKTANITLTSKVNDLPDFLGIDILPNPSAGDFVVKIEGQAVEHLELSLFDTQGRLLKTLDIQLKPGVTTAPFEGLQLPKGMYQLRVRSEKGMATFSVVVQ